MTEKHGHRHGRVSHSHGGESVEGGPAQQENIQLRGLVEGALLYVGIPAVTLYPLGFIALGVQLWRDPAFPYQNLTTVWEATALIPETVVMATGIRLIYVSLIAIILGAPVAGMLFSLVRRYKNSGDEREGSPLGGAPHGRRLWSIMLFLLLPLAAASLLVWGDGPIDGRSDNDLLYMAGFVLFALGGGTLIDHVRNQRREGWFLPGLAAAYAAAVLAAMCLAATQTPALSLVRVDVPEGGIGTQNCGRGIRGDTYVKLDEGLSHWYLYNKAGLFAVPHEDLRYVEYEHCPEFLDRN